MAADWVVETIEQSRYLGVGFLMFAETVFPPIPSEIIMSLAGLQAARGNMALPGVIAAGTAGAMLGKDRKSVVEGKSGSVRVDLGGSRIIKKKIDNRAKK